MGLSSRPACADSNGGTLIRPLNILVLGVGGNVSQGILKALALSSVPCRVVGACIEARSFGLYTVDRACISPAAGHPAFLPWLIDLCRAESIDAILSGVEPVLAVLAREREAIVAQTRAIPIVSSPPYLAIGDDKLLTCEWLRSNGFAYPRFAASEDREAVDRLAAECGFPLIAKPRSGKGSHGVLRLRSERDLRAASEMSAYVIEEYLGDPSHEYTAGSFSDRDGIVRGVIVLKRDLLEGTTYRAEAGDFPAIRTEALRIAAALRPTGPCNFQMRLHGGRAVCFEINVRFSGTTPIRARFGFNDVQAALEHYVLGRPAADLPVITKGIALRYWNEAYIDSAAAAQLETCSSLENPKQFRTVIEDYGM